MKFIRRNGRIIPIREKGDPSIAKKKSEVAKGVALVSSAIAVAGGGGFMAGAKVRRAERAHQMAFDFGMNNPDTPSNIKKTLDGLKSAKKRLKVAKRFSLASRFLATGIGAIGISKLIKDDKDTGVEEAGKIAVAAIVSETASRGLYAGFKKKTPFGLKLSAKTKSSGLALLSKLLKSKI